MKRMFNHPRLFWLYAALCLVTAISAIAIGVWQGTLKEPEVITHFETIEVIDEVRVPYPVLVIEEKPVRIWVETEKEKELKHFESSRELERWLDQYPILITPYGDYDCEDYAQDLVELAFNDGYLMSVQYDIPKRHALNSCWVGLNSIYFIEPQTHKFWFWESRD